MSGGTSYNGWPCDSNPAAIDVEDFGDPYGLPFPGGVRGGDVKKVLGYVASQLHYRVEPCVAGWDWGYEYRENVNNPGSMSCHASATAIDYNAPNHPNGARGTFSSEQVATIYDILVEVGGAVQWGGDYTGTADEMHFEIIVDAGYLSEVANSLPDGVDPAPEPEPIPEVPVGALVRRSEGIDYIWTDDLSFFMRIPSEGYYTNLQAAGVITVGHGQADEVPADIVGWYRDTVAGAGGRIFEPAE